MRRGKADVDMMDSKNYTDGMEDYYMVEEIA